MNYQSKNLAYYNISNSDSTDLKALHCGIEQCLPSKHIKSSAHDYFAIHYVISGKGTYIVNGKTFEIGEKSVFVIFPKTSIEYFPDKDDPWNYIWIDYVGLKAVDYLARSFLSPSSPTYPVTNINISEDFHKCIMLNDSHKAKDLALISFLYSIFASLIEEKSVNNISSAPNQTYVLDALALVDKDYANPKLNAKYVSDLLGINSNYFSRIFMKKMSVTFSSYLINYRINKACYLMENNNFFIKEIAEKVGYINQYYFSNEFKRIKACAPSEYYKSVKKSSL